MSCKECTLSDDKKCSCSSLKERLKAWRKEQYRVASQVVVQENTCVSLVDNDRFQCLPLQDNSSNSSCLFGGVDVSFPSNENEKAVAVYVVLDSRTNTVVYHDHEYFELTVPYVSSYLSFREIEPLARLVKKQVSQQSCFTPRAILVDGNGILHARHAGIACFLGVYTGIPTVGVGKSLYCKGGLYKDLVERGLDASLEAAMNEIRDNEVWMEDLKRQERQVLLMDKQPIDASIPVITLPLVDRQECVREVSGYCRGVAVKLKDDKGQILAAALLCHGGGNTKTGTKVPIYISVGHKVSLEEAVGICAQLSNTRIPEPVRQADLMGRKLLRDKQIT